MCRRESRGGGNIKIVLFQVLKNSTTDSEQVSHHFSLCFLLELQAVKVISRSCTTDFLISL